MQGVRRGGVGPLVSIRLRWVRDVLRVAVPTRWGARGGGEGCPRTEEPGDRAAGPAPALQGLSLPSWASASVKGDVHQGHIARREPRLGTKHDPVVVGCLSAGCPRGGSACHQAHVQPVALTGLPEDKREEALTSGLKLATPRVCLPWKSSSGKSWKTTSPECLF